MTAESLLRRAEQAQLQGNLSLAHSLYVDLLAQGFQREAILNRLAKLCWQANDTSSELAYWLELCRGYPSVLSYCDAAAKIYAKAKQWRAAADCYLGFLTQNPQQADAYYNAAYYYKLAGEYALAIENYQQALHHAVQQPEEVLTNMAVIYSEHLRLEEEAKQSLERALVAAPAYTPAMFNLATLFEEEGNKSEAAKYYQAIVALEPENHLALARLAESQRVTDLGAPIIQQLKKVLADPSIDDFTRTNIDYALGKVFDDCGEFDLAFGHYAAANDIDKRTTPTYEPQAQERLIDDNIAFFSAEWFANREPTSDAEPIFICGMFRSGSTLTEQVLASHSQLTAGGERDFFYRLVRGIKPYPFALEQWEAAQLEAIATDYLNDLAHAFPGADRTTDKRPDNFLHAGLIKSVFPNAKFIQTQRNPIDNCLSIYFLRTAASMSYAADLSSIAHYYKQYLRLMAHWKAEFSESIYTIDYDDLVVSPEPEIRRLLEFLGLPWESQCLDFHQLDNRVKTASIWQVRQPLYKSSSGRWMNYQNHIAKLRAEFKQ